MQRRDSGFLYLLLRDRHHHELCRDPTEPSLLPRRDGGAEPITFRLQKQFTPTRGAGAVPSGSLPGSPLFPANRPPQRNLRFLVQGVILRGFQGALFRAVPVFHLRFSTLKPMMENKIS